MNELKSILLNPNRFQFEIDFVQIKIDFMKSKQIPNKNE